MPVFYVYMYIKCISLNCWPPHKTLAIECVRISSFFSVYVGPKGASSWQFYFYFSTLIEAILGIQVHTILLSRWAVKLISQQPYITTKPINRLSYASAATTRVNISVPIYIHLFVMCVCACLTTSRKNVCVTQQRTTIATPLLCKSNVKIK